MSSPSLYNTDMDKIKMDNLTLTKIQSYDAIKIETSQLLKREKTLFMINSVVTLGLLITLFNVI